jgi:recombination protein RecR
MRSSPCATGSSMRHLRQRGYQQSLRHLRRSPPRSRAICVVEEVADLWALDRAHLFTGRYHVLGGRLSALDGVRPEDLAIASLLDRVAAGGIDEVVLAMNATLEGQTTAHYIAERLEAFPVRVTQLAHGLPVGGELDYLDEGTLAQALRARRPVG